MLGAERPTGSGVSAAASSAPIRTAVTATVVSVGPYRFQTSAPGKRARRSRATAGSSVSPQKRKRRSAGSMGRAKPGSARQKRANEGVDTHVVRGAPSSRRNRRRGSAISCRVMASRVPPVRSAPYRSITDRSKPKGAWFRNVSPPGTNGCDARSQLVKWASAACDTGTPLGAPVVPEVKTMYADVSGSGGGGSIRSLVSTLAASGSSRVVAMRRARSSPAIGGAGSSARTASSQSIASSMRATRPGGSDESIGT